MSHAILWLNEIEKDDVSLVGKIGGQLGDLGQDSLPLADGFVVTSYAYFRFLRENNLTTKITHLLGTADYTRNESLMQVSGHIQRLISYEQLSDELLHDIFHAYRRLSGTITDLPVLLTPSEDHKRTPALSHREHLQNQYHAQGETDLILQLKDIWASLFSPAMLLQQHEHQYDLFRFGIAVVVQKELFPEVSGTLTTINPITDGKDTIVIEAVYGMPQTDTSVTPDHYEIDKQELKITYKKVANQAKKRIGVHKENKLVAVGPKDAKQQKLTDNQILELAAYAIRLERHMYLPQEAHWVFADNAFAFTKVHPLTRIQEQKSTRDEQQPELLPLLLKGVPASPGIVTGVVKCVVDRADAEKLTRGHILVTTRTEAIPQELVKKVAAIVTDTGGRSSHAALLAQALGVPAVVGTENGTTVLKDGAVITVNGSKGEIYKGAYTHALRTSFATDKPRRTATKVSVILSDPVLAEKAALEHIESVGLFQADSLFKKIGLHPKELTKSNEHQRFVDELEHALTTTCLAFHQKSVTYQAIDLPSSVFRELKGGKEYEPIEDNPLLGFRGAARSLHAPELFALELEAIKKVRENKLKNLNLMLPFVRTVAELTAMTKQLGNRGLHRSPTFALWLKIQTPANCISLSSFIQAGVDGVMIDLDDLTTFMLDIDQNNSEVTHTFDEQDPAVLWAIEHVIKTAHAHHIPSSITGKSLAHQTDLVEKLVQWGITSITVPPTHIRSVRTVIADTEEKLLR